MGSFRERNINDYYDSKDFYAARRHRHPIANRYEGNDLQSLALAGKCGRICENAIMAAWTANLPEEDYSLLFDAEQKVRQEILQKKQAKVLEMQDELNRLKHELQNNPGNPDLRAKIRQQRFSLRFFHNCNIKPLYEGLTDPPVIEVPFDDAEKRSVPTTSMLYNLLSETDRIFGLDLMKEFSMIGSDEEDYTKVNIRIKFLVETALFLAKTVRTGKPLHDYFVIPNVWIENIAQLDGILIARHLLQENNPNCRDPSADAGLREPWLRGLPYDVVEIKTDNRSYALHGTRNVSSVPHRHVDEMKKKLTRIVFANHEFLLPDSYIFVHPRGTEETIIHRVKLHSAFLRDWRLGLIMALENNSIPKNDVEDVNRLIELMNNKIDVLDEKSKMRQLLLDQKFPTNDLFQAPLFGSIQNEAPIKTAANTNSMAKSISPSSLWPSIRYLINPDGCLVTETTTKINFGGKSLDTLAKFLQKLSSEFGKIDQESGVRNAQDMHAWLTELFQHSQSGRSHAPNHFLASTGALESYINNLDQHVFDYAVINARQFIVELGGQLRLHLRTLSSRGKPDNSSYRDEFHLLRLIAEKLKGRSLILLFEKKPNDDGSRNIIGCDIKTKNTSKK